VSVLGDRKANADYDSEEDEPVDILEHAELAKAREAQKAKKRDEKFKRKRGIDDDAGMLDKYDSDEEGPLTRLSELRSVRKEKTETLAEGIERMQTSTVTEMGGVKRTLVNDDFYSEDAFKQKKPKKEKKEKRKKANWTEFEEDDTATQRKSTSTSASVAPVSTLAAILGTNAVAANDANSNSTSPGDSDLARRSDTNALQASGLSELLALEQRKALKATAYVSALNAANMQNTKLWVEPEAGGWKEEANDAKSRLERLRAKTKGQGETREGVATQVVKAKPKEDKKDNSEAVGEESVSWRMLGLNGLKEEVVKGEMVDAEVSMSAGDAESRLSLTVLQSLGAAASGVKEEDIFATAEESEAAPVRESTPATTITTAAPTLAPSASATSRAAEAAAEEGFQRARAQARESTLAKEISGRVDAVDAVVDDEMDDREAVAEWEAEEKARRQSGKGVSVDEDGKEKKEEEEEVEDLFEHLSGNPMVMAKLVAVAKRRGYFKREHVTRREGRTGETAVEGGLVYYDDQGRELSTMEAYRHLSYKFHGYGPSQSKLDKQMRKRQKEQGPSEEEKKKAAKLLEQINASPFLRMDTEAGRVEAVSMNRHELEQYRKEKEAREAEWARRREEKRAAKLAKEKNKTNK